MKGGSQWVHEGRGSSCLLWEHGAGGPAAYSRYFGACAGGPATYRGREYSEYTGAGV